MREPARWERRTIATVTALSLAIGVALVARTGPAEGTILPRTVAVWRLRRYQHAHTIASSRSGDFRDSSGTHSHSSSSNFVGCPTMWTTCSLT